LVQQNTDGRNLGVLGDPGVNVLELNLALNSPGTQPCKSQGIMRHV